MRLGLLSDIHEAVELLDLAIERLQVLGVDRFVFLGDVHETGPRLAEAVERLAAIDALGVWGNHDYGLCVEPHPDIRSRFPFQTLDYLSLLHGAIEIDGFRFAHIEPWLDPCELLDLWHMEFDRTFEDEVAEKLPGCAAARSFMGHKHRWLAADASGLLAWRGEEPLILSTDGRWLVVVAAVVDGWCARFDTTTGLLTPIALLQ